MGITKNIGRDSIEAIKQEAEHIRTEYAYMDEMPLEGWLWEFIRRTQDYVSILNELKEIAPIYKYDSKEFPHAYEVNPKVFELLEKITETGLYLCPTDSYEWSEKENRFLVIPLRKDNSQKFCLALPHFDRKYPEISEGIYPIVDLEPVKLLPYEILLPFVNPPKKNVISGKDGDVISGKDVMSLLSPTTPNDTLYFGVSKTAKKEIIMEHISAYLDAYLKPPKTRVRADKWKHYLIAYDLKKYKGLNYPHIAEIMYIAYPDIPQKVEKGGKALKKKKIVDSGDYFTEKNCENFYKEALELIDGGYKIHLLK